ncbi:MAG: hypothetical protein JEZ11_20745 [Desulfobacterales bacterium]|nr:hypothetical protein [Desulfobacterales bacterium]
MARPLRIAFDTEFSEDPTFSRDLKIFLSKKITGEKLKRIGDCFGISDSAVFHASRRSEKKIDADRKLKKAVQQIERRLKKSIFKT